MINIDELKRFCKENPVHMSPKDELDAIFEYLDEGDPCLMEAALLLAEWDWNNTPLEMQQAQADFFFMKWNFIDAEKKPWRPAAAGTAKSQ